jgi:hypothetical protein
MSEGEIVGCQHANCPVAEDGRCLEGFENVRDCPNIQLATDGAAATDSNEAEVLEVDGDSRVSSEEGNGSEEPLVELGGGTSLTLSEGDLLANKHSARVILVAGEFQSGKTTLIAESYGRFLRGPFCDWSFAGSDSLYALDRRYHGARESSGLSHPDVPRTEDEEMRLLDLRVSRGSKHHCLMFSDIRGEFFDNIVQGSAVAEEVPLAARADLLLVLVDGDKIKERSKRYNVKNWITLLLGGLTESGGIKPGTPVAIVLSKADLVSDSDREWFEATAEEWRALAFERRSSETEVFVAAARPDESPHEPIDLGPIFEWCTQGDRPPTILPSQAAGEERSFWKWSRP